MSNELAIAGVTAVLQHILNNIFSPLTSVFGSTVNVSAVAPDLVQSSFSGGTGGAATQNQVNIFLHQVTYNQGWRNEGFPALASDGRTPLQNPPLPLDLHYLLTAYGQFDWQAEALLGFALQQLHQVPVLSRSDIANALSALTSINLPSLAAQVKLCGLADQIEMIKITPEKLGREEMAWLWTALKADYRPTFPFLVTVVLIEPQANISIPFPVLTRNIQALPIVPAQLLSVQPPNSQPVALPGDTVTVNGEFLSGAAQVTLTNQRLGVARTITLTPPQVTNTTLTFAVPNDPANFPAGFYSLTVQFIDPISHLVTQTTKNIQFAVAPAINLPSVTVTNTATETTITLTCNPSVRPSQTVYLAVNGIATEAQDFGTTTNSLTFVYAPPLPTGTWPVVLQVDNVTSLLQFHTLPTPGFGPPTVTI
jgi:hypothetical protein